MQYKGMPSLNSYAIFSFGYYIKNIMYECFRKCHKITPDNIAALLLKYIEQDESKVQNNIINNATIYTMYKTGLN